MVEGNILHSIVEQDQAATRLDRYLADTWPDLGRRGAKRAIGQGFVKVNDKAVNATCRLRCGDVVEVAMPPATRFEPATIIAQQGEFLFAYKPAGQHTVLLAGKVDPSLQSALAANPNLPCPAAHIQLLQRLDFGTSGIVCAAITQEAYRKYRMFEAQGLVEKEYLAILSGELRQKTLVKNLLDVANRKYVRLMTEEAPPERWTYIEPLLVSRGLTLARCVINRGQRHQIRVHVSSIGHALAGDVLYGQGAGIPMTLICTTIRFPGHEARYIHADTGISELFPDAVSLLEMSTCNLVHFNHPTENL